MSDKGEKRERCPRGTRWNEDREACVKVRKKKEKTEEKEDDENED
jgi:hypothetical protein